MTLFAVIVFFFSLLAIIFLFVLKRIEERRAHVFLPSMRVSLDRGALWCKGILESGEEIAGLVPPLAAWATRMTLLSGMRGFARLARRSAESANRLADFVSHKHNFERRETRSAFLRQVGEYRNGNGNGEKLKKLI